MNKKTKVLLSICAGIVAAAAITGGLLFSQYTTQRASLLDVHDPKVVTTTIKEALMDSGASENTEVTLDQIKEVNGFCAVSFFSQNPEDEGPASNGLLLLEEADGPFEGLYYPEINMSGISSSKLDGRALNFPEKGVTVCAVYGQKPEDAAARYAFEQGGTYYSRAIPDGNFVDVFVLPSQDELEYSKSLTGFLLDEDGNEVGMF